MWHHAHTSTIPHVDGEDEGRVGLNMHRIAHSQTTRIPFMIPFHST